VKRLSAFALPMQKRILSNLRKNDQNTGSRGSITNSLDKKVTFCLPTGVIISRHVAFPSKVSKNILAHVFI
jgi:hypothetical protein